MINKGDKLVLTLKTNNVSFDKLYLGKNDDLAKHRLSRECRKQTAVIPLHLK